MGDGRRQFLLGFAIGSSLTYFVFFCSWTITDKISLLSAIVLVGTLITAVFQDHIRRHFFYPELILDFKFGPPDCHKTEFRSVQIVNNIQTLQKTHDAYYFRFSVTNKGKTPAELCEVVLEKLYKWNQEKNNFDWIDRWNPVNLKWAGADQGEVFKTINPGRKVFCDIGFIASEINPSYRTIFINKNSFNLAAVNPPFNQRHDLDAGKYKIEIAVYSKNLKNGNILKKEFVLNWSGRWDDDEKTMFERYVQITSQK